jgi:hypothetical protein
MSHGSIFQAKPARARGRSNTVILQAQTEYL